MIYNVSGLIFTHIHKHPMRTSLSTNRRVRVVTVGIAATVSLYAMVLVLAEPMRSLAASAAANVKVSVTVAAAISNNCTNNDTSTPLTLGTITRTGDTANNADGNCTTGSTGYFCSTHATTCTIITNNSTGYTFNWAVTTGTGAAGARTGTGHLNGYVAGNRIRALKPGAVNTPENFNFTPTSNVTNDARWAGRLSSTSTTATGASVSWGSDGPSTDLWLNVATGAGLNIAKRNSQTAVAGDSEVIGFRAIIHGTAIVPTDTYRATVVFTATTNP